MIINAYKEKIFPLSPKGLSASVGRDEDEDEDEDRFYTPKEVKEVKFLILELEKCLKMKK